MMDKIKNSKLAKKQNDSSDDDDNESADQNSGDDSDVNKNFTDPKTLKVWEESEVEEDSDAEKKFIGKVKKQLKNSEAEDTRIARQKLTEQRLKKKRRIR